MNYGNKKSAAEAHSTYQILQLIKVPDVVVNYCQTVVLDVECKYAIEVKQCQWQRLQQVMTTTYNQ